MYFRGLDFLEKQEAKLDTILCEISNFIKQEISKNKEKNKEKEEDKK